MKTHGIFIERLERTISTADLMKKGLRPVCGGWNASYPISTADLMKKGLRHLAEAFLHPADHFNRRPDEEGIKTPVTAKV